MNGMDKLSEARALLLEGEYTLVLIHKDNVYTDKARGVKPLLSLYEQYGVLSGAVAADKVVGKAAAMIYVKLGVSSIYADVISTHALKVLEDNGIEAEFSKKVEAIRNRSGDGFCPMETAVMDISDTDSAIEAIYATLKKLAKTS
jgi:hypothetical protein